MPHFRLKLTLFLAVCTLVSCDFQKTEKLQNTTSQSVATFKQLRAKASADPLDDVRRFNLAHSSGRTLQTVLLVTPEEQRVGLSGVKDNEFADNEAALFWYEEDDIKRFWMPDTYFNLDIIFLDESLRIIDIERDMPAHPGMQEPPPIRYTRSIRARHVLEVKAKSDISGVLKIGDQFQLLPPLNLSQIESKIRQMR